MFLTFRFDSLIIHSAGGDGLAQFCKGFGGHTEGRWLALLLIEGGDTHHSRYGSFCPCAVGRVPAVEQVDALTSTTAGARGRGGSVHAEPAIRKGASSADCRCGSPAPAT